MTSKTELVYSLLGRERLALGDLIMTEVLQGFAIEQDFREALQFFNSLELIEIGGRDIAVSAARNFPLRETPRLEGRLTAQSPATAAILSPPGHDSITVR